MCHSSLRVLNGLSALKIRTLPPVGHSVGISHMICSSISFLGLNVHSIWIPLTKWGAMGDDGGSPFQMGSGVVGRRCLQKRLRLNYVSCWTQLIEIK